MTLSELQAIGDAISNHAAERYRRSVRCGSCAVAIVNGVTVHERGCPDAFRHTARECAECGSPFRPESLHQRTCSHRCYVIYNGLDCQCDECAEVIA